MFKRNNSSLIRVGGKGGVCSVVGTQKAVEAGEEVHSVLKSRREIRRRGLSAIPSSRQHPERRSDHPKEPLEDVLTFTL